jgi:hypothetical protein
MKKIKFFMAAIVCAVALYSCVDTEENIVVHEDHSGTYTMKMDMGKLVELLKDFGGSKSKEMAPMLKMDTLIYFKDSVDASTKLTAEEKALYRDAYFKVKSDSASNEFKMEFGCPFKNISQLPEIRHGLMDVSEKLGFNKLMGGKDKSKAGSADEMMPGADGLAGDINPSAKDYDFKASPGRISNIGKKKSGLGSDMANDSMMQMMQQMTMLTGDMTLKTVIKLPHAVKKVSSQKAIISDDKKTVTISSVLTELFEKPEVGEYEIEY